jgi:hypothetical protein
MRTEWRLGFWLSAVFLAGCATAPRDDLRLRRDIERLNLTTIPIAAARARLSERGFVCANEYERYAGSPLRTIVCTHAVPGLACRDEENVTLEYRVDSGLVDRVATSRANACL